MNEELKYSLQKLNNALAKLKEGAASAREELERDGVIQRFEFTFELLWKTLKLFLREKGIDARTPKDCLKEAFKIGWISDEKVFVKMLEDRNLSSHIYSQVKSREIFENIKNSYVHAIRNLVDQLK